MFKADWWKASEQESRRKVTPRKPRKRRLVRVVVGVAAQVTLPRLPGVQVAELVLAPPSPIFLFLAPPPYTSQARRPGTTSLLPGTQSLRDAVADRATPTESLRHYESYVGVHDSSVLLANFIYESDRMTIIGPPRFGDNPRASCFVTSLEQGFRTISKVVLIFVADFRARLDIQNCTCKLMQTRWRNPSFSSNSRKSLPGPPGMNKLDVPYGLAPSSSEVFPGSIFARMDQDTPGVQHSDGRGFTGETARGQDGPSKRGPPWAA
ncbi:hypothetical protein KM043_009903 [Ampulex compressa]|nr:hypothetical protein KM043_009903 [Ampulex compressa]